MTVSKGMTKHDV